MNDFIKTKDGYKKWNNKDWVYYIETTCDNCGKIIIITRGRKKGYKTNKRKHRFCPNNKHCMFEFYQKEKDIKAFDIMTKNKTPNFSYLLGLICTDGHIAWPGCTKSVKVYMCIIELNKKDKLLLINIQKEFGGNLTECKKSNSWRWSIHNKIFIEYLRDIVGLTNNKSHTLDIEKWFNTLDEDNKKHFIRGVIDGDGCIHKTNQDYWTVSICTYSRKFQELLKSYFSNYNYKTGKHDIHFNGGFTIKPLQEIMINTHLHLKRKYLKFQQLLQEHSQETC